MRKRGMKSLPVMAISVALVGILTGCGGSGGEDTPGGDGDTIKIGLVAEVTGSLQAQGASFVRGLQVAADQVNASGGVVIDGKTYKLALDVCNDNSDQTQVAACANKLVRDNGEQIIFGGLSFTGPIVRGVTEANKAIYVSTGSAVAALMSKSHHVLNASPSLEARSSMGVKGIKQAFPNAKRIAFMGGQDATSADAFQGYKDALNAAGGYEVVDTEIVPNDVTDYSSLLTKIKSKNPDVLIIVAPAVETEAAIISQNAELNVAGNVWLTSGVCGGWPNTPGRAVGANTSTGVIATGDNVSQAYGDYEAAYYKQSSPKVPNPDPYIATALYSYDFLAIMRDAMQKAGSATDTDAIMKAVNGGSYTGISGDITVNDNQALYGQVMCVAKDGNGAIENFKVEP